MGVPTIDPDIIAPGLQNPRSVSFALFLESSYERNMNKPQLKSKTPKIYESQAYKGCLIGNTEPCHDPVLPGT